jgi:hypothetical protein
VALPLPALPRMTQGCPGKFKHMRRRFG